MNILVKRPVIAFAGPLLILVTLAAGSVLLVDTYCLRPYVGGMERAALWDRAAQAEEAVQRQMRGQSEALAAMGASWAEAVGDRRERTGDTGPLSLGAIRQQFGDGDVDAAWLTTPGGELIEVWARPLSKGDAFMFSHSDLAVLVKGSNGREPPRSGGTCNLGGRLAIFSRAVVQRTTRGSSPEGCLWLARVLSPQRLNALGAAAQAQIVFVESGNMPGGVFHDDAGSPMVGTGRDGVFLLRWPFQDPTGSMLGFLSCKIDVTQFTGHAKAARRSILIVSVLCYGLAALAVIGSHILITSPLARILGRLRQFIGGNRGALEELSDGLRGEARMVAKQVEQTMLKLSESSTHDAMTGLANRRDFDQVLDAFYTQASRYGRALSVVLLDVDHFKSVNDSLGHPVGDEILRGVARCIVGSLRGADRPARIGGDEFAVILPETKAEEAAAVGERIRQAVSSMDVPASLAMGVTVSIGVADLETGDAASAEDLVELADKSLYAVKARGRNGVAYGRRVNGTFEALLPRCQSAVGADH